MRDQNQESIPGLSAIIGLAGILSCESRVRVILYTIMNNTHAWSRSLIIGGLIFAAVMGLVVVSQGGDTNLTYRAGYVAAGVGIPTLVTAFWASGSNKEWGWVRYVLTVVVLTFVLAAIRVGPKLAH